jgi:uncharacterized protein (UPF0332 family)
LTDENRKRNIADEIRRAQEALRASEALLDLELYADSVSRAYYAVLYLVRALLLSIGMESRTHQGTLRLFHSELVRPALFPATHNRALAALQRLREFADYDAAATFSRSDALASLADAHAFETDAKARLRATGYLDG